MIEKDTSRVRYLSPEEGVEYGLIDKVLYPQELRVQVRKMPMMDISHHVLMPLTESLLPLSSLQAPKFIDFL